MRAKKKYLMKIYIFVYRLLGFTVWKIDPKHGVFRLSKCTLRKGKRDFQFVRKFNCLMVLSVTCTRKSRPKSLIDINHHKNRIAFRLCACVERVYVVRECVCVFDDTFKLITIDIHRWNGYVNVKSSYFFFVTTK